MQPLDFTTLMAICQELRQIILPARLEQAHQADRFSVYLGLRTLTGRQWLLLSWHPQAARLCLGDAPPKVPDPFSFSQQLVHQLGGLALVEIATITPWERVVDLQFAQRPGDPILWHLYVEIMGQYSNVVLVNRDQQIVTAAYQVGERQSRLRSLQTGVLYESPPTLILDTPSLEESFASWWQKITLIPGKLSKNMTSVYRGLSSALVKTMLQQSNVPLDLSTEVMTQEQAQQVFKFWQIWLASLQNLTFQPAWTATGYTVVGWSIVQPNLAKPNPDKTVASVQDLLQSYYGDQLAQQSFQQLFQQLKQRLQNLLNKLYQKRKGFLDRLQDADQSELIRQQADLLMAYLYRWEPGMNRIELPDFVSNQPTFIPLSPEKNAVQNAQALYKRHQKLKRSSHAINPLLEAVQSEIDYLEQILISLHQLEQYRDHTDLVALEEMREELIQAQYLPPDRLDGTKAKIDRSGGKLESQAPPHRFTSPNGHEILVGRNNRQNEQLTFRIATDYDLWFHAQQIPGSHVLLRLPAGSQPEPEDLQSAANLAAYFSKARESDQAPIVYTQPKHLYKPKGAKLGMVIYKQEQVIWGRPIEVTPIIATQHIT